MTSTCQKKKISYKTNALEARAAMKRARTEACYKCLEDRVAARPASYSVLNAPPSPARCGAGKYCIKRGEIN